MELNFRFHHDNTNSFLLGSDMPREESLRGWVTSQRFRIQSFKFYFTCWKDLLQKKCVLPKWSNLASRKLMRRSSTFRRIQCTIQQKLFLLKQGSGMTFLPTSFSKETRFQPKSKNWSWDWYVIMTKMNEKLTALFNGIRWVQNGETRSRSLEGENSRTQIDFNTFVKETTRWGASLAWILSILYCIFVPSRTHWWESDSAWVDGSRR